MFHFPVYSRLTAAIVLGLTASAPMLASATVVDTMPANGTENSAESAAAEGQRNGGPGQQPQAEFERVVVTASGFEQKLTDAPASISVISRQQLENRPYSNLTDALRDIEGVDVEMAGSDKNGMSSISMRGMPADYTLVLIDGRRQSNIGSIYPNGFGGGQFAFLPPLGSIERIEVVRGPMSTLYGSDAMGGVINIITRRVGDRWHGALRQSVTSQENKEFGDANSVELYLNGPLVQDRLGLSVRAARYFQEESTPNYPTLPPLPDGSIWQRSVGFGRVGVENVRWNAGLRLDWLLNEEQRLVLDADTSRQKFDNSDGKTGTLDSVRTIWRSGNVQLIDPATGNTITRRVVQPRVGYADTQRYHRDQVALTHIGQWRNGMESEVSLTWMRSNNLGRTLPFTVSERAQLQDLWNAVCARRGQGAYCNNGSLRDSALTADEMARLQAFLPRPRRDLELRGYVVDGKIEQTFGAHTLTAGGQWNDTDMHDGIFGMDGAGYRSGVVQTHRQWALFVEDNWQLNDNLKATLGLRYDHHNLFGSHFSPRGYLVWNATPYWTFKGGVSTGYKTPRPNDLFEGIVGFGGQGVNPQVGTPDLQPETSRNYELAAYYENDHFGFNATLFVNRFKDKIASGGVYPNCEVAPPTATRCIDIGPGWAELGYTMFRQTINIDTAETRGAELAGHWNINPHWQLRGNYTYTHSEQTSGAQAGQPISGNPAKHMANASIVWRPQRDISVQLSGEGRWDRYRGMDVNGEHTYYKDHTVLHLGASWRLNRWLSLNARINNLLNRNYMDQTCVLTPTQDAYSCVDDYLVQAQQRNWWLSVSAEF